MMQLGARRQLIPQMELAVANAGSTPPIYVLVGHQSVDVFLAEELKIGRSRDRDEPKFRSFADALSARCSKIDHPPSQIDGCALGNGEGSSQ